MNKINKVLVVLVIVLSILVLALSGYIIYDKVLNKKNNNQSDILEQTKYNNWTDYILNSDIQEITINRTRAAVKENEEDISKKTTISKEKLKEIFTKLKKYNLVKKYTLGMGIADGDILSITYKKDNVDYIFEIPNGYIFVETIDDSELLNIIEDDQYTVENEELSSENGSFYVYKYDYDNSIFDSYFD